MSPSANARNDARLALATLQLDGVITSWRTDFEEYNTPGWTPQVAIAANDELAFERAKRAVQKALEPHIRGVQVTVLPGLLPGGGEGNSFQFGDEEPE